METELKHLHQDVEEIKRDLDFIKNILIEEYALSESAKRQLNIANKTPLSEYIDYKEVKKRLLR